jgi:hypothetical protein
MVSAVGMTVRLKVRIGWGTGHISGQVYDFDAWYITTELRCTYVATGRQLRPADAGSEKPILPTWAKDRVE